MKNIQPNSGVLLPIILLFIFRLFYVLIWIAIAVMSIIFIISIFNLNETAGFPRPAGFRIYFSLLDEAGVARWGDEVTSTFYISDALGSIKLSNIPYDFMAIYSLMSLLLGIVIQLSIRLTIKILKTVITKSFLLIENAVRLRWIALFGVAIFFIDKITGSITAAYLNNYIELPGVKFEIINLFTFINVESVFHSLFLLVIAEIFRLGAKLKEEHDLTI